MTNPMNPALLSELGLTGYSVSPSWEPLVRQQNSELRMYQPDVQTLGRLLQLDTAAILEDATAIGNSEAERLGLTIHQIKRRFLLIEASSPEPLEVRPVSLSTEELWLDPEGGALLLDPVHPKAPAHVVVLRSDGYGLIIKLDADLTQCQIALVLGAKVLDGEPEVETPLR